MTGADSWKGILDDDETVLWQGRPDGGMTLKAGNIMGFLFGLFFAGFALVWMVLASQAGGFFWMFGLLHFFVGVGIAFGSTFWSAWRRRHTWYTLTDRRAFIATDLPFRGRSLKSYPITKSTVIDYDGGEPASIMFNHEMRRKKNGHYRVDVGFERIENGAEVYRMMRDIQKGQAV
ncbi:aspartate carbamoyltransferase catalytic subunit [Roseovarius sp.]|uniref:aspartate carbamoyltransferase catalytic subunit n=1 Tax=Roseovarius sp. TaxID=1486281 RepID=UPI003BACF1EF